MGIEPWGSTQLKSEAMKIPSLGSFVASRIWREKIVKTKNARDIIFELGNLGILRIEKGEEWRQPQMNNFGLDFMEFIE